MTFTTSRRRTPILALPGLAAVTLVFTGITDGDVLEDTSMTAIMTNGDTIYLFVESDGHVLRATTSDTSRVEMIDMPRRQPSGIVLRAIVRLPT